MSITRREFLRNSAAIGVAAGTAVRGSAQSESVQQRSRLVVDGLEASEVNDGFLDLVRQGGAHCVHKTLFGFDSYAAFHGFVKARSDKVVIAGSVRDIRDAHRNGKIAFVLGAQSAAGLYGNGLDDVMYGVPLGGLRLLAGGLEAYRGLGLRVQAISYNTYNDFGSGCLNHSVPPSRAGLRLVEEVHRHRILLDVGGHAGERTSLDAIDASRGVPVVATHTNFAALNGNMRCISDRLAEAIAKSGGVIGLTAVSDFIMRSPETARKHGSKSPTARLHVLLDHYDHARKLVGVDHVALGPDFIWGQAPEPVRPEDTVMFTPDSLSEGLIRYVEGFEDISKLPNLVKGLRARGWTEAELDKVLGENWLRVYQAAWGE